MKNRIAQIDDEIYFRSLSEVAGLLGVTRQRVQQVEAVALSKMQKKTACSRQQVILNLCIAAEYAR